MISPEDLYPGVKLHVRADLGDLTTIPTGISGGSWVTFLGFVGQEGMWFCGVGRPWIYIVEDEGECPDPAHEDGHWYWDLDWFDAMETPFKSPSDDFIVIDESNDKFLDLFL